MSDRSGGSTDAPDASGSETRPDGGAMAEDALQAQARETVGATETPSAYSLAHLDQVVEIGRASCRERV